MNKIRLHNQPVDQHNQEPSNSQPTNQPTETIPKKKKKKDREGRDDT